MCWRRRKYKEEFHRIVSMRQVTPSRYLQWRDLAEIDMRISFESMPYDSIFALDEPGASCAAVNRGLLGFACTGGKGALSP
jgi:hypothetical protein